MATDRTTLIVIPARGASVGIPRKCTKLLGGKPVLSYALTTALEQDADVVVSTDDPEIRAIAERHGVPVLIEPAILEGQRIGVRSLDPVIHWATAAAEWQRSAYQTVVTIQPTSPFLNPRTVRDAIAAVRDGYDTATVVVDDRHLRWEGSPPVLTTPRIIRQQMSPAWRETAAVLATKRQYVTPTSRFGPVVKLIEVSGAEAVDLDTPEDWAVAEHFLSAPSARECLMARVLSEFRVHQGVVAVLSAWDEAAEEMTWREAEVAGLQSVTRLHGAHTYAEAQAGIMELAHWDAEDLTIVTCAYHQPRAFLTFLRVLQETGLDRTVRLWNAPAAGRMEKLAEEWRKITEYAAKGHVASYEDGLRYLDWRDTASVCAT